MNKMFPLFVLAVILGAIGGYCLHEGIDEKTQFERDSCYEIVESIGRYQYAPHRIDINESGKDY